MERTNYFMSAGDAEDVTAVTPRFGSEDTKTAQAVVPLAVVSRDPEVYNDSRPTRGGRSWPLALILVSTLIGGVMGGAGLYLYQQRNAETAPTASDGAEPIATHVEIAQPTPSPDTTAAFELPVATEVEETETSTEAASAESDSPELERSTEDPPRDREDARRETSKRGKKGSDDDEPAGERRPRRVRNSEVRSSQETDEEDEPEARRVDSIVFPNTRRGERSAERRRRRQPAVDRVREIFEGQP